MNYFTESVHSHSIIRTKACQEAIPHSFIDTAFFVLLPIPFDKNRNAAVKKATLSGVLSESEKVAAYLRLVFSFYLFERIQCRCHIFHGTSIHIKCAAMHTPLKNNAGGQRKQKLCHLRRGMLFAQ